MTSDKPTDTINSLDSKDDESMVHIPDELKILKNWGFCKMIPDKDGKPKKIPCTSEGKPRAQASGLKLFDELGPLPDGYGYAFSLGGNILHPLTKKVIQTIPSPEILILDYDDVIDKETHQFTEAAEDKGIRDEIYELAQNGYVERSTSGTGIHAICQKPDWMNGDKYRTIMSGKGKQKGNPEIFCGDKYVWITGNHVDSGGPFSLIPGNLPILKTIIDRQMADYVPDEKPTAKNQTQTLMDEGKRSKPSLNGICSIVESDLYNGNYDEGKYASRSEAAQGLCNLIAFNVDSVNELDTVFKASPFFQKHYSSGWTESKEKLTYTNAFKAKQDGKSAPGMPIEITDVQELPECTYKKNALKIDLSVYPEDHLLKRYVKYVMERTDSYPEYSYTAFLYVVSVLTCGKAIFKQRYSRKINRCILWIMNLGYSTISRKSTAIDNAEGLLKDVLDLGMISPIPSRYPHVAARPGSPEGFAQNLQEHPVSYLIMDEAGELLSKMQSQTMQSIRDDFCIIYDGKDYTKRLSKNLKKDKSEWEIHVDRPFYNMLMCTTFDNFSAYTSRLDITSGWLLRVLYAAPEYLKVKQNHSWTDKELDDAYTALTGELLKIFKVFSQSEEDILFTLHPDAQNTITEWSDKMQEKYAKEYCELKLAYFGRVEMYVQKLAILNHIMTPDFYEAKNTTVSAAEILTAIKLCEQYHIPTFLQIEETVGKEKNNLQDRIISIIEKKGGKCTKTDLLRSIHKNSKTLKPEIESLVESNEIKLYNHSGTIWYYLMDKGDTPS